MIPVKQTRVHPKLGNCAAACIASIFEIPIEQVFDGGSEQEIANDGGWWLELEKWLQERGLMYCRTSSPTIGYTVAVGFSPRRDGKDHHACVAYNGNLVHDPHPDNTFFGGKEPFEWWVFYVLDPSVLTQPLWKAFSSE